MFFFDDTNTQLGRFHKCQLFSVPLGYVLEARLRIKLQLSLEILNEFLLNDDCLQRSSRFYAGTL